MATRSVASVFGGSGFLGRHVVKRLAALGHTVRVAVKDPESALFLKTAGGVGQVVPLYADLREPATIARGVEGAAMVVNLVGILAEARRGDFAALQARGAGEVARAATLAGVERLVQVSAIGADLASPSRYGQSKAEGEQAVLAAFPSATILRPSLVFGPEDKFFNRFAGIAAASPIMPVICGDTRFQPVYVGDVADAVVACLTQGGHEGRLYELGGPDVLSFRDILRFILQQTHRHRPLVEIPYAIARVQAAIAERLPGKPFTTDQLLMLRRDNVVAADALELAALHITPTPIEAVVPAYLVRYRPGGAPQ